MKRFRVFDIYAIDRTTGLKPGNGEHGLMIVYNDNGTAKGFRIWRNDKTREFRKTVFTQQESYIEFTDDGSFFGLYLNMKHNEDFVSDVGQPTEIL